MTTPGSRLWFAIGAINGAVAVALGAYGAHGLGEGIDPDRVRIFDIAVRYHMWHALALLAVGIAAGRHYSRLIHVAGLAFTVGILIFCGSLYKFGLSGERAFIGMAPIGGTGLILGWILLAAAVFRPGRGRSP